jgi:hypothetical protein
MVRNFRPNLARSFVGLFVVMGFLIPGCGIFRNGVEITRDDQISGGMELVSQHREPAQLRSLTNFDWDQVHQFYRYAPGEYIQEVVGVRIDTGSNYVASNSMLVFKDKGHVVKAVATDVRSGNLEYQDGHTWSADVWLVPREKGHPGRGLRLMEPPLLNH